MERITAKDFDNQRSALIQLHEENPGKRGYGEDTTKMKIGELLGFSELQEYWQEKATIGCPENKSYVRQSLIQTKTCPAGLFTVFLNLHYGKTWRLRDSFKFTTEGRFTYPETPPSSVTGTILTVPVFDTEKEAIAKALAVGLRWLDEEENDIQALLATAAHPIEMSPQSRCCSCDGLPEECPLKVADIYTLLENIQLLQKWLSGFLEKESSEPSPVADAAGQIFAFPEEGLPEDYVDEKYRIVDTLRAKTRSEEEAAKEEKQRACATYKTKDRQLKYAEVLSSIETARILSIREPGEVFVAIDSFGKLDVVRGEDVRLYPLSESAFYAAFLHGVEIPITEAADCLADLDDETDDGDGVPFDFSEVEEGEGEESEGAA